MKLTAYLVAALAALMSLNSLASEKPMKSTNPLLAPWPGPYGGLPPFDKIKVTDFKPAFEVAMVEKREEVKAITSNKDAPTFDNTILALEKSGETFSRVAPMFGVWSGSVGGDEFHAVEKELSPVLASFGDEIIQNAELFKRIEAVAKGDQSKLTAEQKRLVWLYETQFVKNGAKLTTEQKKRVTAINQRLAALSTEFSQNELGDEEDDALILDKADQLAGLPQSVVDAAAEEALHRKLSGKWVISNTRSAMQPFLTYATNRDLREKAFKIWASRGDNDNKHDNNKIVTETLKLRLERSKLMGFDTYAHWQLSDTMARDPAVAMKLMLQVWKPAVERAKEEVADMQSIVDREKGGFRIQPWDYRFYAEKVRKAKYDLDLETLKPYLQLDNITKAMHWMAGKLYGFKFEKLSHIAVFNPDMSVYKVLGANGKLVGIWYFDPYARAGKRSGAWMDEWRAQSKEWGHAVTPIVSNNANFVKAKPGEPVLISWDDAITMFHEFGHALHTLNSNVFYASLSGTNTARDWVEFPSQFHEHYLDTPEVLKFLTDKNGKNIPADLIAKIKKAKTFNQGFATVEFLASGILDMKLHLSKDPSIDARKFEKAALKEIGMPAEIIMRHRIPHFGHIFSSEGYAAGYYGYLWAQVLESDAFEAFTEAKGPYDKAVAKKFHDHIMSVGNTVDSAKTYRKFRGRDATADALLKERGFPVGR
ncbi:MAG: M3 family metallopeptidase [Bdellovibrionales bacterium]|nr:M3 family metallopeptidase [Bdellovibrionales bacterium]